MTCNELKEALRSLHITPAVLAALAGSDRSTVWRWLNGRTPVPPYVDAILDQQRRLVALARQLVDLGVRPCVPPIR